MQQTVFASDAFNFGTQDSCINFDCNFTNGNLRGKIFQQTSLSKKGLDLIITMFEWGHTSFGRGRLWRWGERFFVESRV